MLEDLLSRLNATMQEFADSRALPETEEEIRTAVNSLGLDFIDENAIVEFHPPTIALVSRGSELGYVADLPVLLDGWSDSIPLSSLVILTRTTNL
jgi:hypothetical protein